MRRRGRVVGGRPVGLASSSLLFSQDFTPEKKAVVRAPRRGPLPGRKKKVLVFRFILFLPTGL